MPHDEVWGMEGKMKIGVALATFNGEKYISSQLESILNQSLLPDLIVISDGGSADDTIDICQRVLSSQKDIQYLILQSTDRLDVTLNFQKAIYNCNTDYIFLCDQDDYWLKDKIKITIKNMTKYNGVIAFTDAYIVDEDLNSIKKQSLWKYIDYLPKNEITVYKQNDIVLQRTLMKKNIVTGMCLCLNRSILSYVLPLCENVLHDRWIALISLACGNVIAINKQTVLYRQHSNNEIGAKKSMINTIKNSNDYLNKIIYIREMYKEYINIIYKKSSNTDEILKYIDYLEDRISFVSKRKKIMLLFKSVKNYNQYESNPMQIIIKDIIFRIFLSKNNTNKGENY